MKNLNTALVSALVASVLLSTHSIAASKPPLPSRGGKAYVAASERRTNLNKLEKELDRALLFDSPAQIKTKFLDTNNIEPRAGGNDSFNPNKPEEYILSMYFTNKLCRAAFQGDAKKVLAFILGGANVNVGSDSNSA